MIEVSASTYRPSRSATPTAASLLAASLRSPLLRPLLLVNLLLICTHLVIAMSPNEIDGSWSDFLRIDRERSLSEWFETTELGIAIWLLVTLARHLHRPSYLMVAALLAVMLLDNVLDVRENAALFLAPQHRALAELALVSAAAPFVAGFAFFLFRRAGVEERRALAAIFMVLAMFASFAVVIDFVHELSLAFGPMIYAALAVFEEGGELFTLSLLLALMFQLTGRSATRFPYYVAA